MKTNGATWKSYLESWPEGQWFDDSNETYDGVPAGDLDSQPADGAVVEFDYGVVYATREAREGSDLVKHFRAWLKAQTISTIVIQVPKDKLGELSAYLKTIKGKALN